MFLFGPSEKQIENLRKQNKIADLIKIIDSLFGKTDEKSMNLLREAANAATSLLPSNPATACKQLIEMAANDYIKTRQSPLSHRIILLEALGAIKNERVLEEILENYSIWRIHDREFINRLEATLTGAEEISTAVLIKADKSKSMHDRSFIFRMLGKTGDPLALNYLAECLNSKFEYELKAPLLNAIVQFGKAAVTPLTARLEQSDHGYLYDELTEALLKIGDSSAAVAILQARKKLKDTNEADRRTRKKMEEAAKKLGFRCEEHDWNGCMCETCGEIRDEQHKLSESGCICLVCRKEFHDWDECLCRKCSADRHEWVSMGGRGIYLGECCQRCNEKKHWSRDD